MTQLATNDLPDALYAQVREMRKSLVELSLAIIAINGWNRMEVAFRADVGSYVVPSASK